jgi:beta-galactosidase/beta-glucuronidase
MPDHPIARRPKGTSSAVFTRHLLVGVILCMCLTALAHRACGAVLPHAEFAYPFAPQEGMVASVEQPVRDETCLNGSWQFEPVAVPKNWKKDSGNAPVLPPPDQNGWDAVPIRIPSPWNINAFPYGPGKSSDKNLGPGGDFRFYPSYPPSWESVEMGWLRRTFRVSAGANHRRFILHFEAVAGDAQVMVNGKPVGEHFDNFLPFEFDVTDIVHADGENELLVGVRKPDLFSKQTTVGRRPYVAGSMWGDSIVGIWQDVSLLALPDTRVADTYIKPLVDADMLEAEVALRNDTGQTSIFRYPLKWTRG